MLCDCRKCLLVGLLLGISAPCSWGGHTPYPVEADEADLTLQAPTVLHAEGAYDPWGALGGQVENEPRRVQLQHVDVPRGADNDLRGERVLLNARVHRVNVAGGGSYAFVHFYRNSRDRFYIFLSDDVLEEWLPGATEQQTRQWLQQWAGLQLQFIGTVEDHRGTPQLRIYDSSQIEGLAEELLAQLAN